MEQGSRGRPDPSGILLSKDKEPPRMHLHDRDIPGSPGQSFPKQGAGNKHKDILLPQSELMRIENSQTSRIKSRT